MRKAQDTPPTRGRGLPIYDPLQFIIWFEASRAIADLSVWAFCNRTKLTIVIGARDPDPDYEEEHDPIYRTVKGSTLKNRYYDVRKYLLRDYWLPLGERFGLPLPVERMIEQRIETMQNLSSAL